MFKFKNSEVAQKYFSLLNATTGAEPCAQPEFLANPKIFVGDIRADLYIANWASSNHVSKATAEKLCKDCPVYDLCRDYAVSAQEPYGIWGGTRPVDRGITGTVRSSKIWEE